MLCYKLRRALRELKVTKKHYKEHCEYVGEKNQKEWLELERHAQEKHGNALKIYVVSSTSGKSRSSPVSISNPPVISSHTDGHPEGVVK